MDSPTIKFDSPTIKFNITKLTFLFFQVPACPSCGGVLQPQIVFFGANVAKPIVQFVFRKVEECDSVLVLGSSLEVRQ
jgi:NAD-dependent SIR2 family protein deacetylase